MTDAAPPPPEIPSPEPLGAGAPPATASRWNFAAAFAGWLLPGLGHMLLGQVPRGLVLAVTIGTLWLSGLLIGGVSVFDRGDHPAWFLGQMLVAPSFVADATRARLVRGHDGTFAPDDDPPFEPAFARAHEQGTLFTSLAGLLNLLAIIDVLYRDRDTA
ncbi:MAG: DUF6677 family protein [Planctomycetota bacterium]